MRELIEKSGKRKKMKLDAMDVEFLEKHRVFNVVFSRTLIRDDKDLFDAYLYEWMSVYLVDETFVNEIVVELDVGDHAGKVDGGVYNRLMEMVEDYLEMSVGDFTQNGFHFLS